MRYRFLIEGQQVHEPGVDERYEPTPELFRDEQQRVISIRIDDTFKWGAINRPNSSIGDAYSILYTKFRESFCNRVAIQIQLRMTPSDSWEGLFTGFIYATDCTFDIERNVVECKVTDNSFSAQIDSNRSIKFNLDTPFSKNGVTITALPTITPSFFDPDSAFSVYTVTNVTCYRVNSVFEFLVRAMTDGDMGASSPIFASGGDFENLVITTGANIRAAAGGAGAVVTAPYISFDDLWESCWKQFNLWMRVSSATVVIEKASDQYQGATILSFSNVMNIKQSCELDRLYTKSQIGSRTHQDSEDGTFAWPDIRFFTHAPEEYHHTGYCNHVEQELDLQTDFITSSNAIEDIIDNDNDAYDEDIFLVELSSSILTRKYDFFNGPPFVYNGLLVNSEVAKRWQDSITNSIAWYSGSGNDNFHYRLSSASADWGVHTTPYSDVPIDFDLFVSDANARYNTAGDYYDVPTGGFYEFEVTQDVDDIAQTDFGGFPFRFDIIFQKLTSGGVLISEETHSTTLTGSELSHLFTATQGFYLTTGQRIRIKYEANALGPGPGEVSFDIKVGTFKTTEIVNGGGIFIDGRLVNVIKWEFIRKLSRAEWVALTGAPTQKIIVNGTETWMRSVKWNSRKQQAEFVVLEDVT